VITEQLEAGTAIKSKPVHKSNNQILPAADKSSSSGGQTKRQR